jgi:predicted transcriptional regulator
MSKPKTRPRFVTGIILDPEIHVYVDNLAKRMRLSRSWVLNSIVYEYAKLIEKKDLRPLSDASAAAALKEVVIKL